MYGSDTKGRYRFDRVVVDARGQRGEGDVVADDASYGARMRRSSLYSIEIHFRSANNCAL